MAEHPKKLISFRFSWSGTAHILFLLGALAAAADQPQWGQRGSRNMVSEEKGLPDSFDPATGKNVKWTARLGTDTYATPVIADGRVYIGTNNGVPRNPRHQGDRGILLCLDEKDGRLLWQLVVPKLTTSIYWDWPHAGICSPVTVEGRRAYVVTNRGEVLCLDPLGMANGNDGPYRDEAGHATPAGIAPIGVSAMDADIVWMLDMIKEFGIRQHDSAHSSILSYGSFLYVNTSNGLDDSHRKIDAPTAPSLIVLDKDSGRPVARDREPIGPRIFHSTWSSPALGMFQNRPMIIFCGGDGIVYGFEPFSREENPSSGLPPNRSSGGRSLKLEDLPGLKKIWQFDCDPTAPKEDIHRYIGNRRESPSNIKGMPVFFQQRIYIAVGGDLWWGKNRAWLKCIQATQGGDITKSGEKFSYSLERHSMCTPAIYHGLVFIGDSGRRIHCLDAETGQPYWQHEVKGELWASPLVADEKAYFATRQGEFLVFTAGKEKKLLSQTNLDIPINASPVAANGILYLATATHLYALGKTVR